MVQAVRILGARVDPVADTGDRTLLRRWFRTARALRSAQGSRAAVADRSTNDGARSRPLRLRSLVLTSLLGVLTAPLATAMDLVVGTWNLEHLAAEVGAGCRPRTERDYAKLRQTADALDADIVALQEVESAAAAARVFDPDDYAILMSGRRATPSGACRDRQSQARTALHTALAVRRGALQSKRLEWRQLPALRSVGLDDGLRWGTRLLLQPIAVEREAGAMAKGVAEGAARPAAGIELVSLHLKAGCHYGALGSDDRAKPLRRSQCERLRQQRGMLEEWVDGLAQTGRPFVLAGDFNRQLDQPNDHFWNALNDGSVCRWQPDVALGRRCILGTSQAHPGMRLRLSGAGQPFPYPLNPRFPYAIDHIVAGGPAADWLIASSYEVVEYPGGEVLSDHRPIRVRFSLPWVGD